MALLRDLVRHLLRTLNQHQCGLKLSEVFRGLALLCEECDQLARYKSNLAQVAREVQEFLRQVTIEHCHRVRLARDELDRIPIAQCHDHLMLDK